MKEISTEKLSRKLCESLEQEVAVLLRAQHQNIVQLYDVERARLNYFLILKMII